jgi:hypothetical protein
MLKAHYRRTVAFIWLEDAILKEKPRQTTGGAGLLLVLSGGPVTREGTLATFSGLAPRRFEST